MTDIKRVVVTGMGIVSSIGNNVEEVKNSLINQKSGIVHSPVYKEMGFRSQIHGTVKLDLEEHIDKKQLRFMGAGAAYSVLAMEQAIADSGLTNNEISNPTTGLVAGSGGPSTANLLQSFDIAREKGPKRVGPFMVPRCMSSTVSACIATFFKIKGVNFSITSACSTSAHCIGIASDQIKYGNQKIMFAGGGEELDWTLSVLFDAMGAMSSKFNDTPSLASRPYDVDRDGFVIAGGGGMLVLEELEHAKARGAKIYAELVGGGLSADAHHMTAPHPEGIGAINVMKNCLRDANLKPEDVDIINMHGTSTGLGDVAESKAIKKVFGEHLYSMNINSTKSMTGHLLGAAGAIEAIASIMSIQKNIVPPTINHETPDEEIDPKINFTFGKAQEREVKVALSNTFGFGGHNACVIFKEIS